MSASIPFKFVESGDPEIDRRFKDLGYVPVENLAQSIDDVSFQVVKLKRGEVINFRIPTIVIHDDSRGVHVNKSCVMYCTLAELKEMIARNTDTLNDTIKEMISAYTRYTQALHFNSQLKIACETSGISPQTLLFNSLKTVTGLTLADTNEKFTVRVSGTPNELSQNMQAAASPTEILLHFFEVSTEITIDSLPNVIMALLASLNDNISEAKRIIHNHKIFFVLSKSMYDMLSTNKAFSVVIARCIKYIDAPAGFSPYNHAKGDNFAVAGRLLAAFISSRQDYFISAVTTPPQDEVLQTLGELHMLACKEALSKK
jgi:hypothetical protein